MLVLVFLFFAWQRTYLNLKILSKLIVVFLAPISHENTINDDEAYQSEPDKICKIFGGAQSYCLKPYVRKLVY